MWLKKFSLEHLNFKVCFSRPVLNLLNLQGLDVRAGIIMTGISLFFKCGFNYKCQFAGYYYPAARHVDTRKYICCHIPFLIIVNLENI
jgi:hypothetical protein